MDLMPVNWHWVKLVHVTMAVTTGAFFFLRGVWMWRGTPLLERRWVRISPHVIDTLLFATGIGMMVLTRQYPGRVAWIGYKLGAVLLYILLGHLALRSRQAPFWRRSAWLSALVVYGYVVSVALTKAPLPFSL